MQSPKGLFKSAAVALVVCASIAGCSQKSVDDHLLAARQYIDANNQNAAILEYKNAIQLDPKAPAPRYELGKLYLDNNDFDGAEKELNRALELGQPASDVIPLLSVAYQRTGAENALADVDYKTEGLTTVQRAEVGFYKLQALMQLEKHDDALALIDELSKLDTSSVYKGLALSYRAIIAEDYPAALKETLVLKAQAPLNKDVLMQSARLYLANQQIGDAIGVYTDYVKTYPDDITSKFALTSLLIENRDLAEAEPYVDELLAMNSEHGLLNQYKGIIDSSQGDYESALSHLEKAIQNGRNEPVVRLVAGFSAYQMQDYEAAARHLSMIASQLPDNHPGLRMLADSLLQLGQSDDATAVLARVSGGLDSDAKLFSRAGYQLLREGNVSDAEKMVERSSKLSTDADDLARLGILQLSLNDLDGLVNLEAAAEKAPDSTMTQRTLISAYVTTNQLNKAKQAAKEWIAHTPDAVEPHVFLAEIAIKERRFEDAEAMLAQAKALASDDQNVMLAEAKLALAQDRPADAKVVLNAIIKQYADSVPAYAMLYAIAEQDGSAKDVIARASEAVKTQASNLPLRLMLARMYFAQKDWSGVITTLEPVKADKSTPLAYWDVKGQALILGNQFDLAKQHYSAWLEAYPHDKNATLGMLLLNDTERKYQDGVALADKFLAKRKDRQILILKAYFLAMLRDSKGSRDIISSLPEKLQQLPFVRGVNARLAVYEGKGASAIDDAMAAYKDVPNSQNTMLVLACYDMASNKEEAYRFLTQHVKSHPTDTAASMLLAERQIGKDKSVAVATYEGILTRSPDNFVVMNNLAFLYIEQNKLDKALPLAKRAVELQPKNQDAVDTLAQIYIRQNKLKEANTLYDTVMNDPVQNDEVYLNYVELLCKLDKTELARRRLASRQFSHDDSVARVASLKQTCGL